MYGGGCGQCMEEVVGSVWRRLRAVYGGSCGHVGEVVVRNLTQELCE